MTFKDIFPGVSRTLTTNFHDFPGPNWFSLTFQVLEFSRKKSRTFQEAWTPRYYYHYVAIVITAVPIRSQTFHDLLDLHAQRVNFSYGRSMRIIVAVTNAMNRQLTEAVNGCNVVVLQVYHLVRVLNYRTGRKQKKNNNNKWSRQNFAKAHNTLI